MTTATGAGLRGTIRRGRPGARFGTAWLMAPGILFLAVIYMLPVADLIRISFSGETLFAHYARVFSTPLYRDSLVRTIGIAASVALLCTVFGYPTALAIHRATGVLRAAIAGAIVLPYFIATLIRTYAWMVLLGRNGPINKALLALGLTIEPVQLLFGRGAVLLGMTAVLLPLMVLTIYASLAKLDPQLDRAARASGAGPLAVFWRVTLPLTLPGMAAGILLVFVSSLGFFITPTLLGGPGDQMFAMHITQQADFLGSRGFLQALAVFLLAITLIIVAIAARFLGLEFIWGGSNVGASANARPKRHREVVEGWRASTLSQYLADRYGWPMLRMLGSAPSRSGKLFVGSVAGFVIAALIVPIIIVAILSFSRASFLTFPPPAYSLRWYGQFFSDPNWMSAFATSVGIAVLACMISLTLGTGAAVAIVRAEFRAKAAMMTLLVSPLIVPPVVIGMSLYGFFLRADLVGTPIGIAAAHAVGGIPLVVVIVASTLQSVDRRLEQAAAVHGAAPWRVFLNVTIPAIAPGLGAAAFFAFLHSFDELVLSMFLSGSTLTTLPLKLWGDVNYQLSPVLAVVSTLEVLLVIAGLALARPVFSKKHRSAA